MEKIKVLFLLPRCTKSGPVQVLQNIIKYIDTNLFEVQIITINPENPKRSILSTFTDHYTYMFVPTEKRQAIMGTYPELKKAIKELSPDIIHTTGIIPDIIVSRLYREKQLTIIHANLFSDYSYLVGPIKGKLLAIYHIQVLRKIRNVIACSESLSDIYKRVGLRVPYIRNGVDCGEYNVKNDKEEVRVKLGLPIDRNIYIYAASFNRRKNQKFLCEIFSKLKDTEDCLLLLGDGPTYDELKTKYLNYRNIIFQGRVMNVKEYLEASDYFVSSSYQEGMPMGVLEALERGLPVILSDIVQHKEIIKLEPSIGYIYKKDNPEDFLHGMKIMSDIDREKISILAHHLIEMEFNSRVMSQKYQNIYKMVYLDKNKE